MLIVYLFENKNKPVRTHLLKTNDKLNREKNNINKTKCIDVYYYLEKRSHPSTALCRDSIINLAFSF